MVSYVSEKKIALITGSNKGIGYEVARQLGRRPIHVLVGSRDAARGNEAVKTLCDEGVSAAAIRIDVTDAQSIMEAASWIDERHGKLDILINNAGITGRVFPAEVLPPPSQVTVDLMRKVYETNVFGAVAVTNAMLPLLRKSDSGRIVNMSSGLGSLTLTSDSRSEFGPSNVMPYQSSKTALNAITVAYAKELRDTNIKVNSADPGFTATDLNNHRGHRTTEQAAAVVVRLATLSSDGPTGTFQNENGVVAW